MTIPAGPKASLRGLRHLYTRLRREWSLACNLLNFKFLLSKFISKKVEAMGYWGIRLCIIIVMVGVLQVSLSLPLSRAERGVE